MTDIRTLLSFEVSRYKTKDTFKASLVAFIAHFIIYFYLLHNTSIYTIALVTLVTFMIIIISLSTFIIANALSKNEVNWWLALPYARWKLLAAKFTGLLFPTSILLLFTFLNGSIIYITASYLSFLPAIPLGEALLILTITGSLAIISIPLTIGLGFLYILFIRGWAKIGLILTALTLYAGAILSYIFIDDAGVIINTLLHPKSLPLIALITIALYGLIGFILWLTSTVGMRRIGLLNGQQKAAVTRQKDRQIIRPLPQLPSINSGLFQLEWQRQSILSRKTHLAIRLLSYLTIIGFTVLTYFSISKYGAIAELAYGLFMAIYFLAFLFSLISPITDSSTWVILLPVKRSQLLIANVTAKFLMTMQVTVLGLLGMLFATGIALLTKQTTLAMITPALANVMKTSVFMICLIFISLLVYQVLATGINRPMIGISILISLTLYLSGIRWANHLLVSDDPGIALQTNYYVSLALLLGLGLPIGGFLLRIGARKLNEAVFFGQQISIRFKSE